MVHALALLLLAAAPKPGSAWTLTIFAEENLKERSKTMTGDEKHKLDAKLRVKVDSVKGDRADGVTVESPKAAMYLWVPLPAGVASAGFAKQALEEDGVVVLPGSAFGPAGEGFFRIALTVGPERLRLAAERLGRALQRVRRGPLASTV